jgi:hypothetical protein
MTARNPIEEAILRALYDALRSEANWHKWLEC